MKSSILSVVLLATLSAILSFSATAKITASKSNYGYQVQIVKGASIHKRALLGGKVVSSSEVNLSAELSGDVLKVMGLEGNTFDKGAVLVQLEQASIRAKRDSALAQIASASEALRNAGVRYNQSIVSPYSNSPFGSFGGAFSSFTNPFLRMSGQGDPDFDKFANRTSKYTGFQQAKNTLRQAQLNLKQAEERLKDAQIIAPFDGIIVTKHINPGDIVQQGQTLIKFADIKNLQVEVNVPSRMINNFKINKKYRIKLDIINSVVEAVLVQIYPFANNQHSIKVKFKLPKNVPVVPGTYAEVEILESTIGNLTPIIAESAIIWRSSLPSVFVVNSETRKTELRFVRLGEQIGDKQKSVLSGLKVGERIVINPNILMVSGMDI